MVAMGEDGLTEADHFNPVPSADATLRYGREMNVWRFVAGPESLLYYERDGRPNVTPWTADRAGAVEKGDIVLLYAKGSMQRYVAVARVCCAPAQNSRARRRIADREWWTYLQVQPLARSVERVIVEAQKFAGPGSGLQTPRGGQANRVSPDSGGEALDFMVADDPVAAKRLESWRPGGRGPWPRNLDLEELERSDWSPPEAQLQEEVILCRKLADQLVRSGDFRYLQMSDGVGNALSLEHLIRDAAGRGRIDVLLVDQRTTKPTLILIEAKLRATPSWNPVPQAVRYRACLTDRDGGSWTIRAVVVAESFHDLVLEQATASGIEHRHCSRARGTVRPSL